MKRTQNLPLLPAILPFVLTAPFVVLTPAAQDGGAPDEAWPISCWFFYAEDFDEIEHCARRGGDGEVTVDPQLAARLVSREVSEARIDHDLYFVLASGKTAPALPYDNGADYFVEGLARSRRAGKIGFVDRNLDWALPMKLRDPGTRLGAVQLASFLHRPVYGLQVTYSPEVGGDTWTFYFDRETSELVGYRFYHDESKNDGEVIVLDGIHGTNGMRLPQARAWFTHQDDRHLGTDILWSMDSCDDSDPS